MEKTREEKRWTREEKRRDDVERGREEVEERREEVCDERCKEEKKHTQMRYIRIQFNVTQCNTVQ